ncbi:retrovirus-related pol polyprotein from transposon TNT 1-94 [Tanacetum coccineum]|uniref:Retrovirus-related pol polyprotein from transposon TNT 1-94 n=1 Tax=Tanacetum coccineum TaxID=301880 RepID=A0ABQ5AAY0_9ASTR
MHADLKYVESLEDELDELEYDKAEFSNMYDMLLQECVSKDVMCSYLKSSSDLDEITELQCLYLQKSGMRQPNAQRTPKLSVLGKPAPFSNSLERINFAKKKSVSKTNESEGLSKSVTPQNLPKTATQAIVQLILFIVDSGCTKHITGNLSLLCNFVEKYLGTIHFGNDQFAPILGYGDLVQGNIMIKRVYYVEGLNHNLFSVGQFFDADLEKQLHQLQSVSWLKLSANSIRGLWHRRLSHLNFDYINLLSKKDVVIGLPKLKYVKDQLCSSCEVSKAKRSSFKSKTVPSSKGRLNLLHMDLCDDTQKVFKDFLTMIQRNLQALVISVRTDRGTEFLNKTLNAFFKEEGIEHQTSTPRTPEQNDVVERRNHTLVEAARTMLSASKLPLFFWAEAIATACCTQNRSIIIPTHEKTAYHIINDRKPSIKHIHIFGCTCYLTKDGENLDKVKEKGDPCILVGYSTQSKGYRIYNKRTRLIVESIHLRFDEIKEMSETSVANDTSGLVPQRQKASDYDNPDPAPELQNVSPSADTTVPSQQELDLLFGPLYDEFFNDGTSRVNKSSSPTDDSAKQDTLPSTNIHPTTEPSTPTHVNAEENNNDQAEFTNPFCTPVQENAESFSRNNCNAGRNISLTDNTSGNSLTILGKKRNKANSGYGKAKRMKTKL